MNLDNFHKAFENKARLGIMAILMVNAEISFNDLKSELELTDGNLATHLKALEKEEFIRTNKAFVDRKPKTTYEATKKGIKAFENHLNSLEMLIKKMS